MTAVHFVTDDDRWSTALRRELNARDLTVRTWVAAHGVVDFRSSPAEGVYFARLGRDASPDDCVFVRHFVDWAASHNCETVNGAKAVELASNRLTLDRALARHALPLAPGHVARGRHGVAAAVREFGYPLTIAPALTGDGPVSGILHSDRDFAAWFENSGPARPGAPAFVVRRAQAGTRRVRAVIVDGSAVHAQTRDENGAVAVPARFKHPILRRYARFAAAHEIDAAAFEFTIDRSENVETTGLDLALDVDGPDNAGVRAALARYLESRLIWRDRQHIVAMFPAMP